MIKINHLIIAFFLSIFIHIFFVYQIQNKNDVDKIYVLDLSTYKEFKPKKIEVKKTITEEIKKPKEYVAPEKVVEEKIVPIKKKMEEIKPVKKLEQVKELKKNEPKGEIKKIEVPNKQKSNTNLNQNKILQNKIEKKLLVDEEIKSFLMKISQEINNIATKSYPIQSIKRREQGTIVAIVVLNSQGDLLEMDFDKKRPKRLYQKTKQILKNYKFPKPPQLIFDNKDKFSIKIPVNFILK
jgi:outer membrane biosynthesis protein TonB